MSVRKTCMCLCLVIVMGDKALRLARCCCCCAKTTNGESFDKTGHYILSYRVINMKMETKKTEL